jgi:preprotein translocase subunit SecG
LLKPKPAGTRAPGPSERVPCDGYTFAAMTAILDTVQVIISIVLIFLVLLHSGKDAGLSGAFGIGQSGSAFGGGSLVERNLDRWTVFFAILFVVNTIVLAKL